MKVICLCGGYGTRLGDLTKKTPKPMITIGGRTIIQHIVDRLHKHGLTQIIIKTHYLPEQIMEGIGDKALYYYEPVLFNYTESLKNLRDWLEGEEFMVINGDTISEIDFTDMMNVHETGYTTVFMDDNRAAGVWIYPSDYFEYGDMTIEPYRPGVAWYDCGRPDRLEAARRHYENGENIPCP